MFKKEEICSEMRERLNYQTSGYILHQKNGTWTWVKIQKKGSKYNSVAMVTDNHNWRLSAIELSTLFLHLTFAVRIKLHLAARAAIVYDFSSLPNSFKKKKQITNGPPISNKSFKASSLACFNDIISPAKTKSFQSSIQEFYELFLSTRLMC